MSRTAPIIAASAACAALLVGLGVWQLQRLAWKNAIVARIEERRAAPATSVPTAPQWPALRPDDYEYRHVALNGVYEPGKTALVFRGGTENAPGAGPGYLLMTPLRLSDDTLVIVNRGFAPLDAVEAARANLPASAVVVTGLMREPESRNSFTPADDVARGIWYTRDPASIAGQFGLAHAAPFTIDLDADPKAKGWPRPGTTVIDIPNNHLSYAFTWFGLAAALIGVTAVYLRGRRAA